MSESPEILKEYHVKLIPTEGSVIKKPESGHRTKFGGIPDEIQVNTSGPKCPICSKKMWFI